MTFLIIIAITSVLSPAERDSILAETPGNEAFWLEILESNQSEILEDIEYLFSTMPVVDRMEMTEEVLMDHVLGAFDARNIFYDSIPDSLFNRHMLQYRTDGEPLTPYRSFLEGFWASRAVSTDAAAAAEEIAGWIDEHMTLLEADQPGDPVSVLRAGGGTEEELRTLLCASLRSTGIASRTVEGWFAESDSVCHRWLEIWNGRQWQPLALANDSIPDSWAGLCLAVVPSEDITVTGNYVPVSTLVSQPLGDFHDGDWTATISIHMGDSIPPLYLVRLDPFYPDTVEVGQGTYVLAVGFRKSSGAVALWLNEFVALPGDTTVLDLSRALYSIIPLP